MTVIDLQKLRAAMTPKLDTDGTFDPTIFAVMLAEDLLACGMDLRQIYRFAEVLLAEAEAYHPEQDPTRRSRVNEFCKALHGCDLEVLRGADPESYRASRRPSGPDVA